jgi:hypothetical protein
MLLRPKFRNAGYSLAIQGSGDEHCVVVDHQSIAKSVAPVDEVRPKRPRVDLASRSTPAAKAGVLIEIIEGFWNPSLGEIGRGGNEHQSKGSDPSRLQTGIPERPDSQHHVEAFLDQVYITVRKAKVEFDIGELTREVEQGSVPHLVDQGEADLELSARGVTRERKVVFGICNLPHDTPAALEKPRPLRSETQAARAAVK